MSGQPEATTTGTCTECTPADGIMVGCELDAHGPEVRHRGTYVHEIAGFAVDVEVTWWSGEPVDLSEPLSPPAPGGTGQDSPTAPEQARERTGADPLRSLAAEWRRLGEGDGGTPFRTGYRAALRKCADELVYELGGGEPPVMPQDEFGLVKWLQDALAEAIGPAWGLAAVGSALEAVTPVVEHAARAVAGSHEGIRLWMLDCGGLVQKHREHAVEACALLGEQRARAEAAEAKLAEVRQTIAAFFTHHGNSAAFALQAARDLAEGIRQVLDRAPLEALESGKEPRP